MLIGTHLLLHLVHRSLKAVEKEVLAERSPLVPCEGLCGDGVEVLLIGWVIIHF